MKYCFLIILLLISINVNATDWETFKHPCGVFEIDVPKDWGKGTSFRYNSSVFVFNLSESAEFTVSITSELDLPPSLPMKMVKFMFPKETPISEPERERGNGWNSISQNFELTNHGKTRVWLGKFYGYGSHAITVTLSDSEEYINDHKEIFEQITRSIVFNKIQ